MDTTQYGESKYLTPQIIRESPQTTAEKIGIIIGDCEEEEGKFGKQLVVKVSIDKKIKFWKLSKENVVSMQQISKLSEEWLTKKVAFSVGTTKEGRDKIIGEPILEL